MTTSLPATSPMPCMEPEEWAAFRNGLRTEQRMLLNNRGAHAPGVLASMTAACRSCTLSYQAQALLEGRCKPPDVPQSITPLERRAAGHD